jgi:hypothetical protein
MSRVGVVGTVLAGWRSSASVVVESSDRSFSVRVLVSKVIVVCPVLELLDEKLGVPHEKVVHDEEIGQTTPFG